MLNGNRIFTVFYSAYRNGRFLSKQLINFQRTITVEQGKTVSVLGLFAPLPSGGMENQFVVWKGLFLGDKFTHKTIGGYEHPQGCGLFWAEP